MHLIFILRGFFFYFWGGGSGVIYFSFIIFVMHVTEAIKFPCLLHKSYYNSLSGLSYWKITRDKLITTITFLSSIIEIILILFRFLPEVLSSTDNFSFIQILTICCVCHITGCLSSTHKKWPSQKNLWTMKTEAEFPYTFFFFFTI